jgi:co-chaperonin GroES (HSP10)
LIPVNNLIISVNEKAAFRRESGLYITAEAGSAYDHMVQHGTVVATPNDSDLDVGDEVYFKHMLKDDLVGNKEEAVAKYNWQIPGIANVTYTLPKEADDDTIGWSDWILCTDEEDTLYAYGDQIMCKATKQRMNKFDFKERDEPNIVEVVDSATYEPGQKLLKKRDRDYPLEIHGYDFEFLREKYVIGLPNEKGNFFDPMPGISFIHPHDEDGGYIKKMGLWLPKNGTIITGSGYLIGTTHPDLEGHEEVIFEKKKSDMVFVNGREFYAVDNEKILCTVGDGNKTS